MSTKTTITEGEKYHLYKQVFDDKFINLELTNPEYSIVDNYYGETYEKKLILTIDSDTWDKIVKAYVERQNDEA